MLEPVEELYFNWLYEQVASVEVSSPSLRYYKLFRILHQTKFEWFIMGDDNRAEDGEDLRLEYLNMTGETWPFEWYGLECSMLECFIALARRAAFQTEISAREWFWIFLKNLGLNGMSDNTIVLVSQVAHILFVFVSRGYDTEGSGGLFPLKNSEEDQRTMELWDQLSAYIAENEIQ